jgi:hypothetical protein
MSEEKTATLTARIIHVEKKEEIATVERTFAFAKGSETEQAETKTLDDVINEFIQKIQETCSEKGVTIQDLDQVYDQIAIGFALSSRLANEKLPKITIEVPVCDTKNGEERTNEQT